jgi:hypothetical protein
VAASRTESIAYRPAALTDQQASERPAYVVETIRDVYRELFDQLPDSRDMAACRHYLAGVELPTVEELAAIENDPEYQHEVACIACISRPQDACPELEAIKAEVQDVR